MKMSMRFILVLATALLYLAASAKAGRRGQGRKGNSKFRGGVRNMLDFDRGETVEKTNLTAREKEEFQREGKLFSLFTIVSFKNDPCTTTSATTAGTNRNGTCYEVSECASRNGQALGNCAAGFGVCCLFIVDTESAVTENCTYIQSENFPNALPDTTSAANFNVQRCNGDVCYLRLDFETFDLVGTAGTNVAGEGMCGTDTFTVMTNTAQIVPVICGLNTGQHMYIDIGANDGDTAMLNFAINTATMRARMWEVKVTQVECGSPNAPPDTCLQYHIGLTGRLETFNFQMDMDNHLNSQEYSICIRAEEGFCCIQYQVCQDQTGQGFSFDTFKRAVVVIVTPPGGTATPTPTPTSMALQDDACVSTTNSFDYISIPGSAGTCNPTGAATAATNSRYCGQFLNFVTGATTNARICDCTPPFTVDISFNNVDDNGIASATINTIQSQGLCLEYNQVPC